MESQDNSESQVKTNQINETDSNQEVLIWTDGASRGNPGLAGIGVVIRLENEKKLYKKFLGDGVTNNEAEYQALIFALEKVKALLGKKKAKKTKIKCFSDSELLIKQLNHQYKIENEKISQFFLRIWNLAIDFDKVEFAHIPREKNQLADQLANEAIDLENSKMF